MKNSEIEKGKTSAEEEIRFFNAVWQNSDDNMFIVLKNAQGDFVTERSNPALVNLFQLTPEQASGCALKELLPAETYEKIANRYNECIQKGGPLTYEESHVLEASGLLRYWQTMILPFTDPQTGVQRIFGISREITDMKRIAEQLVQANEKLEEEVAARTLELQAALSEMEKISIHDKLTGLYNRHKLDDELLRQLKMAKRYSSCFGLILLDTDNFKALNDSLGHFVADKLLISFSAVLKQAIRSTDLLGRWGGDEFMVVVPQTSQKSILTVAESIKQSLQNYQFDYDVSMTSSIGVTLFRENDDVESMIQRVDKALYNSKNQGKNKISFL